MNKKEKYRELLQQVEGLIADEHLEVSVLANVSASIKETMGFFWVGFYLVHNGELVLGPFQGSPACFHIKKGRGVCGTAWAEGKTMVVRDVEEFPGHIACSHLSRSEIVVPLFDNEGVMRSELDIDHTEVGTFDEVDKEGLEKICEAVARQLYQRD